MTTQCFSYLSHGTDTHLCCDYTIRKIGIRGPPFFRFGKKMEIFNGINKCITKYKPIPDDAILPPEYKGRLNSDGFTLAQWWVLIRNSDPPKMLHHDPTIRSDTGNTIFMIWLYTMHTEPPEWMRHDPSIRNYYGDNAEIVWHKFAKKKIPPKYIRVKEESPLIDCSESDQCATVLPLEMQAKIIITNMRRIPCRKAYAMYKDFCKKYLIANRMTELSLHKWLIKIARKEYDDVDEAVYYVYESSRSRT